MSLNDSWGAIYLGKTDIIDTKEGPLNFTAENAAALTGQTFGSGTDPLFKNIVDVQTNNHDWDWWLDQNGGDDFVTTLPGESDPTVFAFDAVASYNAVITYQDGTTANVRVNLFQDVNGETFLAPDLKNAQNGILSAQPITSLTVGTPVEVTTVGLAVCRDDNVFVPCFAAGTMIATAKGQVAVEALRAGDLVHTRDAGLKPVRWTGARTLTADQLAAMPELRPIRIRAGALGGGTPVADLIVSPQHRILVRSKIAVRMFGADEVLVAAKQLLQLDGIDIATDVAEVTYVHFLCDDHQVVFSNGAETESLYTGAEALRGVGPAAREEIFAIFPELRELDPALLPRPARVLASGRMGRRLAVRHAGNGRPLIS